MSPRRVGILGGMGPEATVLTMQKLIAAVEAGDDADHIPLIIDMNTQVPSRIRHLIEGTGRDPGPVLAGMARRLQGAGAEALAGPAGRVGVLASPAVQRIGLFDRVFAAEGLCAVYPVDAAAMLAAIRSVKAAGPSPAVRATLAAASAELLAEGAAVQMIACTEFSLMSDAVAAGADAFDTLDVLVDGIVGFALGAGAGHGQAA